MLKSVQFESGRSVMRRGEYVDVAVHADAPPHIKTGSLEFWLEDSGRRVRVGKQQMETLEAGPSDATFRLDTNRLRPGAYRFIARMKLDDQVEEVSLPLEIVTDTPTTDFKIFLIGIPGWVLPTGNHHKDLRHYHVNFQLANVPSDSCHRGAAGVQLTEGEKVIEEMVRHGIDFLKYPTVYGWGLAHRPIRVGASWFDPDVVEISAQLTQYYTQSCRRFPVFLGLNAIDEPGVSWRDEHMDVAFRERTRTEPPSKEEREIDLKRYIAYQTFRNQVLNDFNTLMKRYMLEVAPEALFTIQLNPGILTDAGLYPAGYTFLDIQSTHIYDHWPSSNNGIAFYTNLCRANRRVGWRRPLWVMTGCYGIMPDQWRASWSLGMSEKLDGHGYFLGAGELNEESPWAEFSLAEILRINRLCEKYGNFFLSLEKPIEPLALWYSLSQAAAAPPERNYEHELLGAFYALKRAHFPVTLVTDEDIGAGLLKEHEVLMLVGMDYVPEGIRAEIEKFGSRGGKLVADRTTSVQFPDMIRLDADFREFAATQAEVERAWQEKRNPVSMMLRRDIFADAGILRNLPRVKETLAPLVARTVYAQSPDTFLALQSHGQARFVFVANEASVYKHPNEGARWITMQESVPAVDTITMPFARGLAVYDLWSGKRLELGPEGQVNLHMQPAGLQVLCVYPAPVEEPSLEVKITGASPGQVEIRVQGAAGNSGVIPAELELRDAAGKIALRKYVSVNLEKGAANVWTYKLGFNEPSGIWDARLHNLLTRKETSAQVNVPEEKAPEGNLLRRLDSVVIFDEHAYPEFAQRKPLWVIPGEGCQDVARKLCDVLDAEMRPPEDSRSPDKYPEFLDPEKNRGVWMMPRWEPLNLSVGADVVLVGAPENNILINDLNQSGMLMRVIHPSTLGRGEGLVEYVWSPFDLDKDAVIITAYDQEGLQDAADRFLRAAGLRTEATPSEVKPLVMDLATEERSQVEPAEIEAITPDWLFRLNDGVRKLDAGGGITATGAMDSRLSVFDNEGNLLWQRDFDYRVLGVAVSSDGQFVAASAFPRTYVFDRAGNLLFFSSEGVPSLDDVEGLALQSGELCLVKGTWTGEVRAHDSTGELQWTFPPKPAEENKTPEAEEDKQKTEAAEKEEIPAPLSAVRETAFLYDGSIAVASMKELVILGPDGKEVFRQKIDRLQDVCPAGDNILAASFKKRLYLLDGRGATIWEKETPDFVMAADASKDGTTIAAALFGGEVIIYDAQGQVTHHARLPFAATLTGIAVDEGGNAVRLSTWEGHVLCWRFRFSASKPGKPSVEEK